MMSNKLSLNRDKTQLMILNKDPPLKSHVFILAEPTNITPKKILKFLGVKLSEDLEWKQFLLDGKYYLYNQLKTRISAIKKLSYDFARNFANAICIGKINYASKLWSGAPNYVIKKFQSLQLEVARAVIGPKAQMWSISRLLKHMDWMSIKQLITFTANKLTYKLLH